MLLNQTSQAATATTMAKARQWDSGLQGSRPPKTTKNYAELEQKQDQKHYCPQKATRKHGNEQVGFYLSLFAFYLSIRLFVCLFDGCFFLFFIFYFLLFHGWLGRTETRLKPRLQWLSKFYPRSSWAGFELVYRVHSLVTSSLEPCAECAFFMFIFIFIFAFRHFHGEFDILSSCIIVFFWSIFFLFGVGYNRRSSSCC